MTPDERLEPKRTNEMAKVNVQLIPPHLDIPAVSPIPVAFDNAGSILKKPGPESPPFERLISEAQAQNPKFLQQSCGQEARLVIGSDPRGTVVMMIRVEADGHVSATKIEESSGSPQTDEVTTTCIVSGGLFEPHRAAGEPVGSWQRVHWTWPGS